MEETDAPHLVPPLSTGRGGQAAVVRESSGTGILEEPNAIDTQSGEGGPGGKGGLCLGNHGADGATGDVRAVSTF